VHEKENKMKLNSIDLFSGIGGLSLGLKQAGFDVLASIEIDEYAVKGYKLNHSETVVYDQDIRKFDTQNIKELLNNEPLHLLAGCPPCQGFSSIRRLNKKRSVKDDRNNLVLEFLRFVEELKPLTVMMENVPGLKDYYLFKKVYRELKKMGYNPKYNVINVREYGIPQNRKRLVLVGSILGDINIAVGQNIKVTVRDIIGKLPSPDISDDPAHKVYPKHSPKIMEMIKNIPKNGGGRKDVPEFTLACHKKPNVGFNDVYGRLRWDDYSTTITGGCLNPSKGRFLHPEENRCISAREAALLQSFPMDYKLPVDIPKSKLALLIGNALPPKFSFAQANNIKTHIIENIG
jgi:DNA (cytosine-5)-methyltransferase 1